MMIHLSTIIIVTDADAALATETLRPEATELNVGLGHTHVGKEEPSTKHGLGEDVKNGVGDDLTVNADLAGTVGDTPNTVT